MKRRKPLKPGPPPKRKRELQRKRIKARRKGARRAEVKFAKQFGSVWYVSRVCAMPCLVCGQLPSDPHHVRTVGAGGTWRDLVPLCRRHHTECHTVGVQTFTDRYDVDLHAHARRIAETLTQETPE